jgi:taurine dioxygenase
MIETIPVRQLAPFGAELDLDLRAGLTPEQDAELRRLLAVHDLLVVRGAVLTMAEQERICGTLGPILASDSGLMSRDTPIGLGGVALCFHSDYAYSPEPLLGISLHAVDVVDGETSTRFASGRFAYASLTAEVRSRVDHRRALQVFGAHLDRRNRRDELDPVLPSTVHPLVWPCEGGAFLFAPEMTTDSIVDLLPDESEALLAVVFAALYGPGQVLEHQWRLGDLVVWDNRRVVHARGDTTGVSRRVLQRVTLGTKGYLDLYPELAGYGWSDDGAMSEGLAPPR